MPNQPNSEDEAFALQTLPEFMEKYGIYVKFQRIQERADGLMDMPGARHYKITIGMRLKPSNWFKTYYSEGSGHQGHPDVTGAFACLLSDADAGQYDPFEFMSEFGYTDPKQAKKIWQACVEMRKQMLNFLGEDLLEEALYETEAW